MESNVCVIHTEVYIMKHNMTSHGNVVPMLQYDTI
jgi:hypothetical protein